MIFEIKYINSLFRLIEEYHNKPFWVAFLDCVAGNNGSGASEYEIYFNYMLKYYPNNIKIRNLTRRDNGDIRLIDSYNLDYISCHWHSK